MSNVVVAYSLTSSNVEQEVPGSKSTILCRESHELEYNSKVFFKVFLRFTRTSTTYITFFDVKFEHSNLQGPFCLLSHTTSLCLMIFVTRSYNK